MFTSEFLGLHHRTAEFACGNEELDHWLVSAAPGCQSSRTARTYVWVDDANDIDAAALAFYERCDFRRLAADANRLAMKMSTAVRLLASA